MATSLHDCALEAEKALEKLATEMAHAGIDPQTVAVVTKMADVSRKLVSALGQGQEQTGDNQPPAPPAAEPQHHTIASATAAMHQDILRKQQQASA